MIYLIYFFMLVSAVGMIFGIVKHRQGYSWAQNLTILCAVITLLLAFWSFQFGDTGESLGKSMAQKRQQYNEIVGEKIGDLISENYAGANVLVIAESQEDKPFNRGLKQSISDKVNLELVVPDYMAIYREQMKARGSSQEEVENLELRDSQAKLELSMLGVDVLEEIIQNNLEDSHEIIIFSGGLPNLIENSRLWRRRDVPPFILVKEVVGVVSANMANLVRRGNIAAMVIRRPESKGDTGEIPEDKDEAFDRRFLMLTPDNIDQMMDKHSDLFR